MGHEFPRRTKKVHLDSCSTYNSICDPELLNNIRDADVPMRGHCNAGVKVISKVGDFGGVESWLDETGIANILSIPVLKKLGYHITYDSHGNYYQVSKDDVSFRFNEGDDGLPYIDAGEEGLIFVQTVRQQYEGFTKKQVEKAILARKATGLLGYPTERDMEALVSNNLDNVPFTVTDIRNAKTIFGPDLAGVRGKTVRESPKHVVTDVVAIPRDFMKLHKFVTLVADVMFVNSVPFLVTSSRGIKFVTAEHLQSRTAKQLSKSLKRIMCLYSRGGMIVQTILMDMEFDKTKSELMDKVVVNTTAAREHVAEVERAIRTLKERARAATSVLPFKCLHKLIVTNAVYFAVLWLNAFPAKNGVSAKYSPCTIVVRTNP